MHPQFTPIRVYIYALTPPDSDEPRYVGQTSRTLAERFAHYMWEARRSSSTRPVVLWIRDLLAVGQKPEITVLALTDDRYACALEQQYIASYRAVSIPLLNAQGLSMTTRWQRGRKRPDPQPIVERFLSKVNKTLTCWLWTGSHTANGRGSMRINGRLVKAPRIAWELFRGPIPDGMYVLHNCPGGDNAACVNPDHLWLGTYQDNIRDTVRKGRAYKPAHAPVVAPERRARGDRHGSRTHPERLRRGEDNKGGGKLTTANVVCIKQYIAEGRRDWTQMGREFGVSDCTISRIAQGIIWAHVHLCDIPVTTVAAEGEGKILLTHDEC